MRRTLALAAVTAGLPFLSSAPANAGCEYVNQVSFVDGVAVADSVLTCSDDSPGIDQVADAPPTDMNLDTNCVRVALSQGEDPLSFCDIPAEEVDALVLTPDIVAAALSRIPLPPSELLVQPPNGRTLVNFDTNFYTEAEPFARTVTLLGQRVDLNITPASFGWRFGDGETTSTTSPGSAYPDLEITHSYLRKGRVSPSVDTTYTATFRVNGGPWQPVPGSVNIPGPTVALQVVTARPQLVG